MRRSGNAGESFESSRSRCGAPHKVRNRALPAHNATLSDGIGDSYEVGLGEPIMLTQMSDVDWEILVADSE